MNRYLSLAVLLAAALLASCGESGFQYPSAPLASARVKFHNFSPSSVGVDFFANDAKVTAISSSACTNPSTAADSTACSTTGVESTVGTKYGRVASGGLYDAIAPGQYTLAAKIAAEDATVSSVSQTIADGKYYSFFMSGVYDATANTADAFVVEDDIPALDFSVAYVRSVNAVSDGTGDLNLFVTNAETKTETAIGGPVAYKAAGSFVSVPPGTYSLAERYTGSSDDVISRAAVSLVGGHVYTITARGSTATASTLGLDFTENQR